MSAPPFPLSSVDDNWWALDGSWSRQDAASELHYNLMDWWVCEHVWFDEDDKPIGWVSAFRHFLDRLRKGFVRPFEPGTDDDEVGESGWWFECDPDHPKAVPAWVWTE